MRPLRYSINVTLDGCCDHRAIVPDEELHRHHAENLAQADALLFGRVTYEMMEAAWRPPAPTGAGQGTPHRRREAPAGVGGAGIDRRVRVRGAAQDRGPWADVVHGTVEANRLEAREPAGARFGGSGDAV